MQDVRDILMKTITLIPIGHVDEHVLRDLADQLKKVFPYACSIGEKMELPPKAFNVERSQFLASAILEEMKSLLPPGMFKIVGVTDVDLYVPDLNFVFGLADVPGSVAVISLSRLRQEFYGLKCDDDLFRKRVAKEAIHELGHSFGLAHCQNSQCVMSFSNSLVDTDRKGHTFCTDCQKQLTISE